VAHARLHQPHDPDPHTEEFTWADAERAKLTTKDTWKSWPKQMLTWRAVSNAVNIQCPEVAMGFEITELVQDELAVGQPPAPTLAQVAAERGTPAAPTARATPVRDQEPVDADVVDDEEIRAAVEALHAQATVPAGDSDGWPAVAPIPGTEGDQ
jgi:hypothetical protein